MARSRSSGGTVLGGAAQAACGSSWARGTPVFGARATTMSVTTAAARMAHLREPKAYDEASRRDRRALVALLLSHPLVREDDQLPLHVVEQDAQAMPVKAERLSDGVAQDGARHRADGQTDDQEEEDRPGRALASRRGKDVVEGRARLLPQKKARRGTIVGALPRHAMGQVVQAQRRGPHDRPAQSEREERAEEVGDDRPTG